MIKIKVSKKEIKDEFRSQIIKTRYCQLKLLDELGAFAYSTRIEGWACDYYELNSGWVISTGYDAIGKELLTDEDIEKLNNKLPMILKLKKQETRRKKIRDLINKAINKRLQKESK